MKYLLIVLTATTIFLGYKSYDTSKKMNALTKTVSDIQENIDDEEQLLAEGTIVPDFRLLNADNKLVSLNTFPATQKIFVFSATDCPYCKDYYPELAAFTENNENIPVVLFHYGSSVKENKEFLIEKNYTFEMLNSTEEMYDQYMISGTPTTIIVDANNKVVKADYFSTAKEIEAAL